MGNVCKGGKYYPAASKGAQGKEKGVFSKKQILMLLDLLADMGAIEKIDYRKPTKFDKVAEALHALTGKSASSFKDELIDYKTKGLYDGNKPGEVDQVIRDLTTIAELFRGAGFHSIAKEADKKIRELTGKKSG